MAEAHVKAAIGTRNGLTRNSLFNFQSLARSSRSIAFVTKMLVARGQLFKQWVFYQQEMRR
jgi:hypothetical protein